MYKRADVKVWFACNNHCIFCVQWDKRKKFGPRTLTEIQGFLQGEYDGGARWVVFTGWEPTVHKNLVEAVEYAKRLWYKDIQIQSNGTNFHREDYLRSLLDAGATEFTPSIHGFHPEMHDALVQTPWSWEKLVKWLILLVKYKQIVATNTVITQDNYKQLPELAALLAKIGVEQMQFAFVHILGSADKNKSIVVPRKSEVMPYVYKALDIAKKNNIKAFTEAIPYCFMQGYEYAIAENTIPETSVLEAEYTVESFSDYRLNEGKIKWDKCKKCKKYDICEGPWREYPEIFGWDEFNPL